MKKKKREIEYEVNGVEYETPVLEPESGSYEHDLCSEEVAPKTDFDAGYCWCGKKMRGCKGNPTKLLRNQNGVLQFVCPFSSRMASAPAKVFETARKAGLLTQEERQHGQSS